MLNYYYHLATFIDIGNKIKSHLFITFNIFVVFFHQMVSRLSIIIFDLKIHNNIYLCIHFKLWARIV